MKSAGESKDLSREPMRKAISAVTISVGSENIGVVRALCVTAAADVLLVSLSPPGTCGFSEVDGLRDTGVDGEGVGAAEGLGDTFVFLHAAVVVNLERGAEYDPNKPNRPPGATLVVWP